MLYTQPVIPLLRIQDASVLAVFAFITYTGLDKILRRGVCLWIFY